jgi:DNA replication protein DnaC
MSDRHTALTALLRSLRLTTMAEQFDAVAVRAAREGLSHTAFLEELVQQEAAARAQRQEARRLQESHLPREKTLTRLDLTPFSPLIRQQIAQLQTGAFVTEAMNVVVVGKPGAGKSHLCAAIGHALIAQGHRVRWYPTATLVQQLLAAKRDLRLPQELAKLHRIDCLILVTIPISWPFWPTYGLFSERFLAHCKGMLLNQAHRHATVLLHAGAQHPQE